MWKDFKAFMMKGNLVQLAVAFILGVALRHRSWVVRQ